MPIVTPISPDVFLPLLVVGAAMLAAWALVRFETTGPRTIGGAVLAKVAALCLLFAVPPLADAVEHMPEAKLVIVLVVGLPIFTYFFLAAGWFARVVIKRLTP